MPVLRVWCVGPDGFAAFAQPGVELGKAAKLPLTGFDPDAPPAVLHVLLDHAFLPAAGDVAEIGIEQVVAAHGSKAGVDHPAFAFLDLVDRCAHVVVNAPPGHSTQCREGSGMGVKQHFVPLAGVCHQPESPTGTQLQVGYLGLVVHPAHDDAFFTPIELEGLTQLETQRHKCPLGLFA